MVNLLTESFSCFRDEAVFQGRRVRFYKRAQILVADLWACFDGEGYGEFEDIHKITMFAGMSLVVIKPVVSNSLLDYRIPQMLHYFGCLMYSPPLESHIRRHEELPSGSNWEIELRSTSIWCVELIRREIEQQHPEVKSAKTNGKPSSNGHANHSSNGDTYTNGHSRESSENQNDGGNDNDCGSDAQTPQTGRFRRHSRHSSASNPRAGTVVGINAILIDFFLYDTMKEIEKEGGETIPHHRTRSIWY